MKSFPIIFFSVLIVFGISEQLLGQKNELEFVYAKHYVLQPRYKLLQHEDIDWSTAKLLSGKEEIELIIEAELSQNFEATLSPLDTSPYWIYNYRLEATKAEVVGYKYLLHIIPHYGFWSTMEEEGFDLEEFIKEHFASGHLVRKLDADGIEGVFAAKEAFSLRYLKTMEFNVIENPVKDYMLAANWFYEEQVYFEKELEQYLSWQEKKEQSTYFGDFHFSEYSLLEERDRTLYYLDVSFGNICGGEYYGRKGLLYWTDGITIKLIDENLVEEQELQDAFEIEGSDAIYLFFQSPTNNTLLKLTDDRIETVDGQLVVNYNCGC